MTQNTNIQEALYIMNAHDWYWMMFEEYTRCYNAAIRESLNALWMLYYNNTRGWVGMIGPKARTGPQGIGLQGGPEKANNEKSYSPLKNSTTFPTTSLRRQVIVWFSPSTTTSSAAEP